MANWSPHLHSPAHLAETPLCWSSALSLPLALEQDRPHHFLISSTESTCPAYRAVLCSSFIKFLQDPKRISQAKRDRWGAGALCIAVAVLQICVLSLAAKAGKSRPLFAFRVSCFNNYFTSDFGSGQLSMRKSKRNCTEKRPWSLGVIF